MLSLLLPILLLIVPVDAPVTGVVFVAGGAGSVINLSSLTRWALQQKSSTLEVREVAWSHGKGRVLRDVQDIRHLAAKADELALHIMAYQAQYPNRPIYLVGKSTGAMVVLQAAEQLPAGSLDRIILLSPAVSPQYDLQPALRSTKREIVSFRSSLDVPVLNWGTSLVGTADRYYSKSAGLAGFVKPEPGTPAAAMYERLEEVSWGPAKMIYGHFGGHMGNGTPLFLLFEVVPYLIGVK